MSLRVNGYVVGAIGTNVYLVWDDVSKEAMLIDPADGEQAIEQAIAQEKLTLKYIFLTHGHGDHIGGLPAFLEIYPDAELVCGEDEEEMLTNAKRNFSSEIFGQNLEFHPDFLVADGSELKLGDIVFKVIATPGHTRGGISLYVKGIDPAFESGGTGTLFSGDTLFRESIGRTDLWGGSYDTLINSVSSKLFTLPDETVVLPGHMGATSIAHEKKFNPFV
ncbi:MAG: MBL fold metallo-hydrolase [Clostridiales Family XIII bacterium]|jgi:glyoxylase-like metal-dependent hydrolase (beta-lactamase superfamily II)|nr:MBL fold metallo-hydrolase [Clostridiales Family XIII bacterium]